MPNINDFLNKSKKKFSKDSEEAWSIDVSPDVSPPDIKKRKRPGRRLRLLNKNSLPETDEQLSPTPPENKDVQHLKPHVRTVPPALEPKPGTTTGDKQPINRGQTADQPGTTGDKVVHSDQQPGTTTGDNRGQPGTNTVDRVVSNHKKDVLTDNIEIKPGTTGDNRGQKMPDIHTSDPDLSNQGEFVPGLEDNCTRLEEPLYPVKRVGNRGQPGTVPGSEDNCTRLKPGTTGYLNRGQPGTTTGDNRVLKPGTTGDKTELFFHDKRLPTSQQQHQIIEYIFSKQQHTGLAYSPRLKRAQIASDLNISINSIKKQIDRLCKKGYIERLDARDGRGDAGTIFRIPPSVVQALHDGLAYQQPETTGYLNRGQPGTTTGDNRVLKPGTTGDKTLINGGQEPLSSSSLNITTTNNTTPTPDKSLAEQFKDAIEQFGLDDHGIGPNDVMDVWRKGPFSDSELPDLICSLEHIGFYLCSSDAKGIDHPKAWAMKQLKRGYYPSPAGFKSLDEQKAEVKLKDALERKKRIIEIKRKQFETDFEVWCIDLPKERRAQLTGQFKSRKASSAILKEEFARETDQENLLNLLLEEEKS